MSPFRALPANTQPSGLNCLTRADVLGSHADIRPKPAFRSTPGPRDPGIVEHSVAGGFVGECSAYQPLRAVLATHSKLDEELPIWRECSFARPCCRAGGTAGHRKIVGYLHVSWAGTAANPKLQMASVVVCGRPITYERTLVGRCGGVGGDEKRQHTDNPSRRYGKQYSARCSRGEPHRNHPLHSKNRSILPGKVPVRVAKW